MTEAERLANALDRAVQNESPDDNVIMVARWFVEDSSKELRRLLSESLRIETLHSQAKRELFDAMQLNHELIFALESIAKDEYDKWSNGARAQRTALQALEKAKQ